MGPSVTGHEEPPICHSEEESYINKFTGIRAVSFDGDGTLWDFEKVMRHSLRQVLNELERINPRAASLLDIDKMIKVRERAAEELKGKTANLEEIRLQAFRETLKDIDKPNDILASHLNEVYLHHRFEDIELFEDVLPTLNALRSKYSLGLLSNGNSYPERCDLNGIFQFVVFSQNYGAAKPDSRLFEIALEKANCSKQELLHVGDSLENDVTGAINAGIRCVWLNRKQIKPNSGTMKEYVQDMNGYWETRFSKEGKIWGDSPSRTATYALGLFQEHGAKRILVPGVGYGRNAKPFSSAGFNVVGIEASETAFKLAKEYDPGSTFLHGSYLDIVPGNRPYDAVYCFNLLHLFRENERKLFIDKSWGELKKGGLIFFVVFSEKDPSFGKGREVEKNTFESKPGRPVHYFDKNDLQEHFQDFSIIENATMEDPENHGEEGAHSHVLRYIFARKNLNRI